MWEHAGETDMLVVLTEGQERTVMPSWMAIPCLCHIRIYQCKLRELESSSEAAPAQAKEAAMKRVDEWRQDKSAIRVVVFDINNEWMVDPSCTSEFTKLYKEANIVAFKINLFKYELYVGKRTKLISLELVFHPMGIHSSQWEATRPEFSAPRGGGMPKAGSERIHLEVQHWVGILQVFGIDVTELNV